jgi:hypothetical protein
MPYAKTIISKRKKPYSSKVTKVKSGLKPMKPTGKTIAGMASGSIK